MPGPVSDSYDPVWGTAAVGYEVRAAIRDVESKIGKILNSPPKYILDVIRGKNGPPMAVDVVFSERELRIIRYAMRVALEEEDI